VGLREGEEICFLFFFFRNGKNRFRELEKKQRVSSQFVRESLPHPKVSKMEAGDSEKRRREPEEYDWDLVGDYANEMIGEMRDTLNRSFPEKASRNAAITSLKNRVQDEAFVVAIGIVAHESPPSEEDIEDMTDEERERYQFELENPELATTELDAGVAIEKVVVAQGQTIGYVAKFVADEMERSSAKGFVFDFLANSAHMEIRILGDLDEDDAERGLLVFANDDWHVDKTAKVRDLLRMAQDLKQMGPGSRRNLSREDLERLHPEIWHPERTSGQGMAKATGKSFAF
jgi:hypothetical protein